MDSWDEPEEIVEIEETPQIEISNTMLIISCKKRYTESSIPSIILDRDLQIVWANSSFISRFGETDRPVHQQLIRYFQNLNEIKIFKELLSSVRDQARGFSWQGRVTAQKQNKRSDVANMIVTPLDLDDNDAPVTYSAIFDIVTDEYRRMLQDMFLSLLEASKLKDNDTGKHIERVNRYSRFIADDLRGKKEYPEINEDYVEDIGFLAAMHDVGKIGTPDDILNKSGPLETWEREVMNEHTKNGAYILSTYPNPMARQIALSHHEKWDGTGYPFGMANQMIPLCARIVALADVYDALRMRRSYKDAFSHEKTKEIILGLSGTHFDPEIIACFTRNDREFDRIFTELTDDKND